MCVATLRRHLIDLAMTGIIWLVTEGLSLDAEMDASSN